ncbi:MAG: RluA family pseudouridine synthase [Salinarimonadaceae bacterium]|nr:MAG: RluA family pseudouridine synthase [Salinarimonadaceae bacterium]
MSDGDASRPETTEVTIRESVHAGEPVRLDRALTQAFPDFSRARLQDLVRDGRVSVDGSPARQPSMKVADGARLVLVTPPPSPPEPAGEAIPLMIVHEDSDLVVLDKPAGLVVHPAGGHESGTLVNALIAHCGDSLSGIGGVARPGIVHRLDKDTSGLLVVAKNDAAHRGLSAQFADHGRTGPLERAYLALCWGAADRPRFTIDAPIARSAQNREKMRVVTPRAAQREVEGGGVSRAREAITHVETIESFGPAEAPLATLLRCTLETGRTHQIRVHLAHRGLPLLGDQLYGSGFASKARLLSPRAAAALEALGRQALHATLLGFAHPRTGETMRFESPPPDDLAALVAALREDG